MEPGATWRGVRRGRARGLERERRARRCTAPCGRCRRQYSGSGGTGIHDAGEGCVGATRGGCSVWLCKECSGISRRQIWWWGGDARSEKARDSAAPLRTAPSRFLIGRRKDWNAVGVPRLCSTRGSQSFSAAVYRNSGRKRRRSRRIQREALPLAKSKTSSRGSFLTLSPSCRCLHHACTPRFRVAQNTS